MGGLTTGARRLVEINRSHSIISGEWLDRSGSPVTGHPDTWVKLRYRFENGQQVTLTQDDRDCLLDNDIEPRWLNDKPPQVQP